MISLAGRDILHAWGKFVFTGIGLGLLIGVTLTMAGVYRGMVDDAHALLNNSRADLWPRSVLTKARVLPSPAHCTSSQPPSQTRSSLQVERCWSGGICRRIVRGAAPVRSITTRSITVTCSSPANGYFHCSTLGAPTLVPTMVMVLVRRWSCWKVAIFCPSGDQASTALSVCFQPALSVA